MLQQGDQCPLCEAGRLERRAPTHEITIGGILVKDATQLVLVCAECGEPLISLDERRGYERRAAAVILRERSEVPPGAIRVARKSLGLTQKELALLVGAAHETVSRWENGHLAIQRAERLAIASILEAVQRGQMNLADALEGARASNPPQPTQLEVKSTETKGAA